MRGLYISFVIKRRKKIDKIMDFFLVIAIFIFIFTFLFYVQYVQKANKYNSTNKDLQAANAEAATLKAQVDQMDQEHASDIEKSYNKAFSELALQVDETSKLSGYIKDIYDAKLPGVTINVVDIDKETNTINITLSFDRSVDSQVDYRYRAALLEYSWIPKNGIKYTDTNLNTKWEVLIDGSTTSK